MALMVSGPLERCFSTFQNILTIILLFQGPTTAAGAIGGIEIVESYLAMNGKVLSDIDDSIRRNDSFNFYSTLCNGTYHIVTGHTGTNVMDLHLLYFKN